MSANSGIPAPDPGLGVLEHAVDALALDEAYRRREDERSVSWWPSLLVQRLAAGPPQRDEGEIVSRVSARTEVLEAVTLDARRRQVLSALSAGLVFAALEVDEGEGTLSLVSEVWAHAGAEDWCARTFAFAAAMQAAQAEAMVERLARLLGARRRESEHPSSGPRNEPDEMLQIVEGLVRPRGAEPSAFEAGELDEAWERVFAPAGIRPVRDGSSLWASLPLEGREAIVLAQPAAKHPVYGSGALVRAAITPCPGEETPDTRLALAMVRGERAGWTRAHLLGGWYPEEGRLVCDVFLPSASRLDDSLGHVLFAQALRLRFADHWLRAHGASR